MQAIHTYCSSGWKTDPNRALSFPNTTHRRRNMVRGAINIHSVPSNVQGLSAAHLHLRSSPYWGGKGRLFMSHGETNVRVPRDGGAFLEQWNICAWCEANKNDLLDFLKYAKLVYNGSGKWSQTRMTADTTVHFANMEFLPIIKSTFRAMWLTQWDQKVVISAESLWTTLLFV